MASKREQILQAITTALAGTTQVSTRIYRSRVDAFARNEAPALVVEGGPERCNIVSNCKLDWTMDLIVAIYTRGITPDQLADPIRADVHAKLMANRTIGGLAIDILPTSMDPQLEKADQPALWMVNTYSVRYRTSVTSLES